MEAMCGSAVQFSSVTGYRRIGEKRYAVEGVVFSGSTSRTFCVDLSKSASNRQRKFLVLLQSCKDCQTPTVEFQDLYASFDKNCLLKRKAREVASCLSGSSIFLVGMMGSGKTTVGKVLAEAMGCSFIDSDLYVEQAIGGLSLSQIFNEYGEKFFRAKESEALRELSSMPQQVVGTGGGAVVQSDNWYYMKRGVTVFLDVPLDTLARRIAAVGTNSRPLLHCDSGIAYTTFDHALISFLLSHFMSDLSVNMGLENICDLTPTAIAMEVLERVEKHLKGNDNTSTPTLS